LFLFLNNADRKVISPATGEPAKPFKPGHWYELWYAVDNARRESGGQRYDLYVRGGESATQQRVFKGAEFRMQRTILLVLFMTIANTGPHKSLYGNGGVR